MSLSHVMRSPRYGMSGIQSLHAAFDVIVGLRCMFGWMVLELSNAWANPKVFLILEKNRE